MGMASLLGILPTSDALVRLSPAELAPYVLRCLAATKHDDPQWHRRNFCRYYAGEYARSGGGAALPLAEAWSWLEVNGLICQHFERDEGYYMITRLGRTLADQRDLAKFIEGGQLPEHFVHRTLRGDVRDSFLGGRFDTAVFEAFRALEVAIRSAAGLGNDSFGTKLVARAFDPNTGPLSDPEAELSERQALLNLFTGAIGSYKNPQSHRHVGVRAEEAREMLILASHLLGIVDSRLASAAVNA
jgi:uncharacterized protein (TIGR02391 family)